MCGINGILAVHPRNSVGLSIPDFKKINDMLYHRGPDEDGYYFNTNILLGMRRLKIIDLNTGKQPIHNEDSTIWIVFNGEIYNYKYLIKSLSKNHIFYTKSDTEVIVHLYEEYGLEFLKELRGMFAFAIWDEKKQKLLIARDRLGEKPLLYTISNNHFMFSSELKCILSIPWIERKINIQAMYEYFSYLYVPGPHSIFQNINKLEPASCLIIDRGKIETFKYWQPMYIETKQKTEKEYVNEAIELLRETVSLELISEVPLGAFLSGGIDSSIIVALMSQVSNTPVETFTVGYKNIHKHHDERVYAKAVSDIYKTKHHEFILSPNIEEVSDRIISFFDEPFADASAIPNYLIAREAKRFVTVALSGLGGDEICGGYERYLGGLLLEKYRKIPGCLTNIISNIVTTYLQDSKSGAHFNDRIKRFLRNASLQNSEYYYNIVSKYNDNDLNKLFNDDIVKLTKPDTYRLIKDVFENNKSMKFLNQMILTDLKTYLHGDLLTLSDRMSMANSLEIRVPFLDHRVIEFFGSLPVNMKVNGIKKKYLLKKIAERFLPNNVIYRKKKGFSIPLAIWLRGDLKKYTYDLLSKSNIESMGLFRYKYIEKIIEDHMIGKENNEEKIWALINFTKWHRRYM